MQQTAGQQATAVRLQRALEDVQRWKDAAQHAEQAATVAQKAARSSISGGVLADSSADAAKLLAGA